MTKQTLSDVADRPLVGPYRLEEQTGTDGAAEIYRAKDLQLGHDVVLKIASTSNDHTLLEAFRRQAQVASKLEHAAIVELYDYGEIDRRPFLVMELVPGPTLESVLRDRKVLPVENALGITEDVLAALGYAHERGVLHGALGTESVLLAPDGRAKVMGFGSTQDAANTRLNRTSHLAPELIAGLPASVASDLYSVGVLLYRMLAGRLPFDVSDPSGIPRLSSVTRPEIPNKLDPIVERALALDPARRYSSAAEMRRDVAAVRMALEGRVATIPPAGKPLGGHEARPLPLPARLGRTSSGRTSYAALAGLLLLGAIFVGGAAARQWDSGSAQLASAAGASVSKASVAAETTTSLPTSEPSMPGASTVGAEPTTPPTSEPARAQAAPSPAPPTDLPEATSPPADVTPASSGNAGAARASVPVSGPRPAPPAPVAPSTRAAGSSERGAAPVTGAPSAAAATRAPTRAPATPVPATVPPSPASAGPASAPAAAPAAVTTAPTDVPPAPAPAPAAPVATAAPPPDPTAVPPPPWTAVPAPPPPFSVAPAPTQAPAPQPGTVQPAPDPAPVSAAPDPTALPDPTAVPDPTAIPDPTAATGPAPNPGGPPGGVPPGQAKKRK